MVGYTTGAQQFPLLCEDHGRILVTDDDRQVPYLLYNMKQHIMKTYTKYVTKEIAMEMGNLFFDLGTDVLFEGNSGKILCIPLCSVDVQVGRSGDLERLQEAGIATGYESIRSKDGGGFTRIDSVTKKMYRPDCSESGRDYSFECGTYIDDRNTFVRMNPDKHTPFTLGTVRRAYHRMLTQLCEKTNDSDSADLYGLYKAFLDAISKESGVVATTAQIMKLSAAVIGRPSNKDVFDHARACQAVSKQSVVESDDAYSSESSGEDIRYYRTGREID
jgi:hypothetical protein